MAGVSLRQGARAPAGPCGDHPGAVLLSHRLRGFSPHESSLSALRAAQRRGIPSFEVDTRVSGDGEILVYHDVGLDHATDARGTVADLSLRAGNRPRFAGAPPEPVPTLRELLAQVAARPCEVLIDIKDFGHEAEHIALIRELGLARWCWIVSWMPEVLLRVHALAPELRLSFSHLPATRQRLGLRLLGWSAPLLRRLVGLAGSPRGRELAAVDVYRDRAHRMPVPAGPVRGRFPVHILRGLPQRALGCALAASGGGVGIDVRLLTPAYARQVREAGLRLFVFTVDDPIALRRVERIGVDRVFTDNPALFDAREPVPEGALQAGGDTR